MTGFVCNVLGDNEITHLEQKHYKRKNDVLLILTYPYVER